MSGSAPFSSNNLATCVYPLPLASMSGVQPNYIGGYTELSSNAILHNLLSLRMHVRIDYLQGDTMHLLLLLSL